MGYEEAFEIAHKNNFDIVCLQECYRALLPKVEGEFTLAEKTRDSFLDLAIYYRTKRFNLLGTQRTSLQQSFFEKLYKQKNERIVVAKLHDKRQRKTLFVASFHAVHLVASNYLRRIHVREAIEFLNKHNPPHENIATVIVGDYNYPWLQNGLKKVVENKNYKLFITKEPTLKNGWFTGRFDLASARHIESIGMTVLPGRKSDHAPIAVTVGY